MPTDPFHDLQGLPHIVLASGQTLPTILLLRELEAREYVLLFMEDADRERLHRACRLAGCQPVAGIPDIRIPRYDSGAIEKAARDLEDSLAKGGRRYVLNYTPGTKQTVLGLTRGLRQEADSPLIAAVYLNGNVLYRYQADGDITRELTFKAKVRDLLQGHGLPPLRGTKTPLNAGALGYDFKVPNPSERAAVSKLLPVLDSFIGEVVKLRKGLGDRLPTFREGAALLAGFGITHRYSPGLFVNGGWLEVMAFMALEQHARLLGIDDVVNSVEGRVFDAHGADPRGAEGFEVDVCFSMRNVLHVVSCKTAKGSKVKDAVVEVATRARQVGGKKAKGTLLHWHLLRGEQKRLVERNADFLGVKVVGREALATLEDLARALVS